ncbi:MAG: hypothetical protein LBL96_06165 [Clostridiales bacterium]|jgi:hypothetical protein|nr:hypothetical protein [Clostridiales bacterium]
MFDILKILVIILLYLVALALVLLCVILFIPIRYKADAEYHDRFSLEADVRWMGALRFMFSMSRGPSLFIFGKARMSSQEGEQATERHKKKDIEKDDEEIGGKKKTSKSAGDKPTLSQRVEDFNSIDKVGVLREGCRCLARLLKALLPSRLAGRLDLAFADPSVTGMAYGLCCAALYPLGLYESLVVTSNFERDKIAATLRAVGSVTIWSIIWPLVALALSKPVRPIIIAFIFEKGENK